MPAKDSWPAGEHPPDILQLMFNAAYVTAGGELKSMPGKRPLAAQGRAVEPLEPAELIPLPRGSVLSLLPDRTAVSAQGELPGFPAAALLPIGYTRTLLPAYAGYGTLPALHAGKPAARGDRLPVRAEASSAAYLPLFGYAAVAVRDDGQPYVAALPTDDPRPWQRRDPGYKQLRRLVKQRLTAASEGVPLLEHLAHCALAYECRSAQHVFYGGGEGALPSSPVCNAACVGCISDQPDASIQPHERLAFLPSIDEAVELAVRHLDAAPDAIISFGQGCEGEPLLNSRNVHIVRRIRQRTSRGTININTNGSRPKTLRALIDAGLGSIRVSMFSAREAVFRRYYRPTGYGLGEVAECLRVASTAGLFTSVNLLTFPGITDDGDEVAALIGLYVASGVDLVQLRNLNIDPEQLLAAFDGMPFAPLGIRRMVARFHAAGLRTGSYTHTPGPRRQPAAAPDALLAGLPSAEWQ
ncbi:MAG TPA: radical SAM protein [Chloroflexota bacterium]|nr:radical SAM protein [Chloroflexota bacterium]